MSQLFSLLWTGLTGSALDIDNALYMTAVIQDEPRARQRALIFWGLLIELIVRIALVAVFTYLVGGSQVLFTVWGVEITVESIALLAAGAFLSLNSGRELLHRLRGKPEEEATAPAKSAGLGRTLLEMSAVNALLSIDTLVALMATISAWETLLYVFLFSALLRLLFVRQIAALVQRWPAVHIVLLALLILIGLELLAQGLGLRVPEIIVNLVMLAALAGAIAYQWSQRKENTPVE